MNVNPIEYIRDNMNLVERYSREEKIIIAKYWKLIRWTRQNGKIAENIIKAEFEYWEQFETEVVVKALKIHIDTPAYAKLGEKYTRGIIRNVAAGITTEMPRKETVKSNKN